MSVEKHYVVHVEITEITEEFADAKVGSYNQPAERTKLRDSHRTTLKVITDHENLEDALGAAATIIQVRGK